MWYAFTPLNPAEAGEIAAQVHLPETSPWFSGHFPGFPVLPGIAQLAMVGDAIGRSRGRRFQVSSLRRVRFKQMIRPGDTLNVIVSRNRRNDGFAFRITAGADLVCSGTMDGTWRKKEQADDI